MKLFHVAKFWIPLAFVATVLCLLVSLAVQQDLRMSANDPQIQLAEDNAVLLNRGISPSEIVRSSTIDISQSLAPYLMVLDKSGNVIASSAILHGKIPLLPTGVLANAVGSENRLTWQPETGVRSAIVVVQYDKGFVVAGRSLREVEIRERNLNAQVFLAWAASLIGSFVLIVCLVLLSPQGKKK